MTSFEIIDDVLVIDRSTAERYAECPAQARLVESGIGRTVGRAAVVGEELHRIIGEVIRLYIGSGGDADRTALLDDLFIELRQSRADIQPHVLNGFRASAWKFCDWLWRFNPSNILRYDGGQGERNGQMSWDFEIVKPIRFTSEVDFLCPTASPEMLEEIDFKTGWRPWTAEDVAASFQFQSHAYLVFQHYPDVAALRTKIWNTRTASLTYSALFTRNRMQEYETRILSALGDVEQYRGCEMRLVETRPTAEKCATCAAATKCPVADLDVPEMVGNPGRWLDRLAAVEATADAIRKRLGMQVDLTGEDIKGTGIAFGYQKPPSKRKPPKSMYETTERQGGDEQE